MKYRSRISVLLFVLTFGVLLFPLLFNGEDLFTRSIVTGVIYTLIVLFTLLIFISMNYTITENTLIVKMLGFNMGTINIARIKTIKRSYNPLSSPAASLKRLEIKFHNKGRIETAIISPAREADFLKRLKEINPYIEIKVIDKRNILRFWDWDI